MNIRKATPEDYKKISLIFREEYTKSPYQEKWTEVSAFEKIKEYSQGNVVLVIEEPQAKEIIGFIMFNEFLWDDGPRILIDEIVVTEKFQGQGIGRKLMEEAERISKNKGKVGITLIAHKKAKSIGFYEKLGFKENNLIVLDKNL